MSSFADRVIHMKGKARGLGDVEKTGDPFALAAELFVLNPEHDTIPIGPPRASSIQNACIRMHVLGFVHNVDKPEWTDLNQKITYGIGKAVHWIAQNTPVFFGENRYGWWMCGCCKHTYFGAPPKKQCKNCGASREVVLYHEHWMRTKHEGLIITGHTDLFMKRQKQLRVNELKTINGEEFDKLKAPIAEHEWQVQAYLWGLQHDRRFPAKVDSEVGYLTYFSKKAKTKELAVKTFVIQRNEEILKKIRMKLAEYADGIKHFPNRLPDLCPTCRRNPEGYQRRTCPVSDLCRGSAH